MAVNKYLRKATVVICAAVVTLTLNGCRKHTPNTETFVVEPGIGVGPIKFGMSKEDVIKHLGKPDKVEGNGQRLNYVASGGISVLVPPTSGVQTIDLWSEKYPLGTVRNFDGKTKEGIGMNAGRAEIITAYGEPDKTSLDGPMTTLHYQNTQTQFVLLRDVLVNLKMNAPRPVPKPSSNLPRRN